MTNCLPINNNISVDSLNNKYNFNLQIQDNSYGLYPTISGYNIYNIPKNYPIGFYDNSNSLDISNIITVDLSTTPIIIYVSKGSDISFNNFDYYRFYDSSFNLINIKHITSNDNNNLTDVSDNFYFMNNKTYKFIATTDFCNNHPFSISGSILTNDYSLNNINDSFNITIPHNADNSDNIIYYWDFSNGKYDISNNLYILIDSSNVKYYYDDITIKIDNSYSTDYSNVNISIKSFSNSYNTTNISNIDIFSFQNECSFIINFDTDNYTLLSLNQECLNKVSKATLKNESNIFYEFNTDNHGKYITDNYDDINIVKYGIYNGNYFIFNIDPNYPIAFNSGDSTTDFNVISNSVPKLIDGNPYYSNNIEIIVNNEFDYDISIIIYDISNQTIIDTSNKLVYQTICVDDFNNKGKQESLFKLYNLQNNLFDNDTNNDINNIIKYDARKPIPLPNPHFIAKDRFNHDLSFRVFFETSIIDNFIQYTFIDFENNNYVLFRIIQKDYTNGPFIEISNSTILSNLFYNKSLYSNRLIINNNDSIIDQEDLKNDYNILNYINVYAYDKNGNIIYLPYDIIFTSNINSNTLDISYDYLSTNTFSPITFNNLKYYISYFLDFNSYSGLYFDNNGFLITNIDISSIKTSVDKYNFLNDTGVFELDPQESDKFSIIRFNDNENTIRLLSNVIASSAGRAIYEFKINNIDYTNNTYTILFDMSYRDMNTYSIINTHPVNIELTINTLNNTFDISISLVYTYYDDFLTLSYEIFKKNITGSFNKLNIFDPTNYNPEDVNKNLYIDNNDIGNYKLNIIPKGIISGDFLFDQFFNEDTITINSDLSRIININIINNIIDLSFLSGSIYKTLNISKNRTFDLISDVSYVDNSKPDIYKYYDVMLLFHTKNNSFKDNLQINHNINSYDQNNFNIINSSKISLSQDALENNDDYSLTIDFYLRVTSDEYSDYDISSNIITLTLNFSKKYIDLSLNNSSFIDKQVNINNNSISYFETIDQSFSESKDGGIYIKNVLYPLGDISYFNELDDITYTIDNSYRITITTDVCFNSIGRYTISYDVVDITRDLPDTSNIITRIINVIDEIKPKILFNNDVSNWGDLTYITRNELNTMTQNTLYNSAYSNIDFSINIDSDICFADLSKILFDFSFVDNYNTETLDYSLNKFFILSKTELNSTYIEYPFNIYTLKLNNIIDNSGKFIKPATLKYVYKTIDENSNDISAERIVKIVDITKPNIEFSFNPVTFYHTTEEYVIFDKSYIDFSYQMFDLSTITIKKHFTDPTIYINFELSSILLNFDLSDNITSSKSCTIKIEDNSDTHDISIQKTIVSNNEPVITERQELFNMIHQHNHIFFYSKVPDYSFNITYNINDNNGNEKEVTRTVKMINTIQPSIQLSNSSTQINISFGDLSFNPKEYFVLTHPRLNFTPISNDISYILPPYISSISGEKLYDVSALIYQYVDRSHDISFYYNINQYSNSSNFNSDICSVIINVINNGPIFNTVNTINHNANNYLSDASLIFNVNAYSTFDEFWYKTYQNDISYLFTNFTISYETSLNFYSPEPGQYNISYIAIDENNKKTILTRTLNVIDDTPPNIIIDSINPIILDDVINLPIPNFNIYDTKSDISYIKITYNLDYYIKSIDDNTFSIKYNYSFDLYEISNAGIETFNLNDLYSRLNDNVGSIFEIISQIGYTEDISTIKNHLTSDISIIYSDDISLNIDFIAININSSLSSKILKYVFYQTPIIIKPFIIFKLSNLSGGSYFNNDISINLDSNFNNKYNEYAINSNYTYFFTENELSYDNENNTLTYKINNNNIYDNQFITDFSNKSHFLQNYLEFSANFISIKEIQSSNIIQNIDYNIINSTFEIFITVYDSSFNSEYKIINFKINDGIGPTLNFIDYNPIGLEFPIVNQIVYQRLRGNIFYPYSSENELIASNGSNIFTKNKNNEVIFSIPGIIINDNSLKESIVSLKTEDLQDHKEQISKISNTIYNDISLLVTYAELSGQDLNYEYNSYQFVIETNNQNQDENKVYRQKYTVYDLFNNSSFITRDIVVKKFDDIIVLDYEKDANENIFIKSYHEQYKNYDDKGIRSFNYCNDYKSSINYDEISKTTINNNELGSQNIVYTYNGKNYTKYIDVVKIECLSTRKSYNLLSILNNRNSNYIKFGLYDNCYNTYNFTLDDPSDEICLFRNNSIDVSDLVCISNGIVTERKYKGSSIYKSSGNNNISIYVSKDFNRISLLYIHKERESTSYNETSYNDVFLYSTSCIPLAIPREYDNTIVEDIIVTVSGDNEYILNYNDYSYNYLNDLILPMGTYRFLQNTISNFYRRIKFSTISGGIYNGGTEFTNNLIESGLPGLYVNRNNYGNTLINFTFNTPNILYYYSDNFPNVKGGKIIIRNNMVINRNNIYINDNVLSIDNSNLINEKIQNTGQSEEIKNNKIYLSMKNTNNNNSYNLITQQNIYHNILLNTSNDKIVFTNYRHLDNSNNNKYLFDSSVNSNNTNILQYNCKIIQNSDDVDTIKNDFSINFTDFYNVYDYQSYFINNFNSQDLYPNNYISKINEIRFTNFVSLIVNNEKIDFFLDKDLNSSIIEFDNIYDNLITFNLETYFNKFNNNQYSKLFFQNFFINIRSDIASPLNELPKFNQQGIIFSNNTIELNDYLLKLEDNSNILYELYSGQDQVNIDYTLENIIFFSIKPNNDNSINYIGFTMQNIYHNMFINDNEQIIFHSYDQSVNNYQVNSNLTLEDTLYDSSNNQKYLLENTTEDIYGCMFNNNNNNNIFNSGKIKNNINNSSFNYKTAISYFIHDELSNNNLLLNDFDIVPKNSLPCVSSNYNDYNILYDYNPDNSNSYSYYIDLNDYFDRNFYDNSNLEIPYNVYNKNNLIYNIIDISYKNLFNIYDICSSAYNIIYDKKDIRKLNELQNKLLVSKSFLDYIELICINLFNNLLDYNHDDYLLVNQINLQNTFEYMNTINNLLTENSIYFNASISNDSLNVLFFNNLTNSDKIINNANKLIKIIDSYVQYYDYTKLNISTIDHTPCKDITSISKLENKINFMHDKIKLILETLVTYENDLDIRSIITVKTRNINLYNKFKFVHDYSDLYYLNNWLNIASEIKNIYNKFSLESYLKYNNTYGILYRDINDGIIQNYTTISCKTLNNERLDYSLNSLTIDYDDIYDISSVNILVRNINNNFIKIHRIILAAFANKTTLTFQDEELEELAFEISNNVVYDPTKHRAIFFTTISEYDDYVTTNFDKNLFNLIDQKITTLNEMFNNFIKQLIYKIPDFTNKLIAYDTINYTMTGSKLLINSYKSNNILIKFNLTYNSLLYQNVYVDTFVLDLALPDLIPPTLIFNNNDISGLINDIRTECSKESINYSYIFNKFYNDLSFIEINQSNNYQDKYAKIKINDKIYTKNNPTNYNPEDINMDLYTILFDLTDININKITFRIKDNANNINTIIITSEIKDDTDLDDTDDDIIKQLKNKPFNNCSCPVYYKDIQHNYKLGSYSSSVMRRAKFILKR